MSDTRGWHGMSNTAYAQCLGEAIISTAQGQGWKRGDPEDAFMFVMRRCREVALDDVREAITYARNSAFEHAAEMCEQRACSSGETGSPSGMARQCARDIRALKHPVGVEQEKSQ